ncbi:MAG: hypothetical protein ACP5D1_06300 [Bacteroidales bacterium]
MAKLFYACFRKGKPSYFSRENIEALSGRLEPDNIKFTNPRVISGKGIFSAIFNENPVVIAKGSSICLGTMVGPQNNWWVPKRDIPDGTYALFRSNEEFVEVISDATASRTIWYYFDEEMFIAATSQRAIVFFLRDFHFNERVIPWMLSSGTPGPGNSWDNRLKMLEGNSSLLLDRNKWKISVEREELEYHEVQRDKKNHEDELLRALTETFRSLDLDYSKWILTLSGGSDSRSILYMLKDVDDLTCITWGLAASRIQKSNDAYIAALLAQRYNKDHRYYLTHPSIEPVEKILNRYLICSEGRIDHIIGYVDGFRIWKELFNECTWGVIRGDQEFGQAPVYSEYHVRLKIGFPVASDFTNLEMIGTNGIYDQIIPDRLQKKENETLATYRDRVYHEFRQSHIMAALNDIKSTYLEIVNPLLCKNILRTIRTLPDELRTNKKLIKEILTNMDPSIPFARHIAIDRNENFLSTGMVQKEMLNEMGTSEILSMLPEEFAEILLGKRGQNGVKQKIEQIIRKKMKHYLSNKIKGMLKSTIAKPGVNYHVLLFRMYILSKMKKLLDEDAGFIQPEVSS